MTVTIAIVGSASPTSRPRSQRRAIAHSAAALGRDVHAHWVATDAPFPPVDAIWCVGERLGGSIMPELSIPDDRSGVRLVALGPAAERRLALAVLPDAEPLPAALALMQLRSAGDADRPVVRHA